MVTSNLSAQSACNELTNSPDLWGYTVRTRYVRGDVIDTGVLGGISTKSVLYMAPACLNVHYLPVLSPLLLYVHASMSY